MNVIAKDNWLQFIAQISCKASNQFCQHFITWMSALYYLETHKFLVRAANSSIQKIAVQFGNGSLLYSSKLSHYILILIIYERSVGPVRGDICLVGSTCCGGGTRTCCGGGARSFKIGASFHALMLCCNYVQKVIIRARALSSLFFSSIGCIFVPR